MTTNILNTTNPNSVLTTPLNASTDKEHEDAEETTAPNSENADTNIVYIAAPDFDAFVLHFALLRRCKQCIVGYVLLSTVVFASVGVSQLHALLSVATCASHDLSSVFFMTAGFILAQLWTWVPRIHINTSLEILLCLWLDMVCATGLCLLTSGIYHACTTNLDLFYHSLGCTIAEGLTGVRLLDTNLDSCHNLNSFSWLSNCMFWCVVTLSPTCAGFARMRKTCGENVLLVIAAANVVLLLAYEMVMSNNHLFYATVSNSPYRLLQFNTGVVLQCIDAHGRLKQMLGMCWHFGAVLGTTVACLWLAQIDKTSTPPCAQFYWFQDCLPRTRYSALTQILLLCWVFSMPRAQKPTSDFVRSCVRSTDSSAFCFDADSAVPLDSTSVASDDSSEDLQGFEDVDSNVDGDYMQRTVSWKRQVRVLLLRFGDYVQTRRLPSSQMLWVCILLCSPASFTMNTLTSAMFDATTTQENQALIVYLVVLANALTSITYTRHFKAFLFKHTVLCFNAQTSPNDLLKMQTVPPKIVLTLPVCISDAAGTYTVDDALEP